MDVAAFGCDRTRVLASFREREPGQALVVQEGKTLVGYCFGRLGSKYFQIGPVVATTLGHAKVLVLAALDTVRGMPVILDVPVCQTGIVQWLQERRQQHLDQAAEQSEKRT